MALDPAWIVEEKAKAKERDEVPFISTNDALTSWFFREIKCDLNLMLANFRSHFVLQEGRTRAGGEFRSTLPELKAKGCGRLTRWLGADHPVPDVLRTRYRPAAQTRAGSI